MGPDESYNENKTVDELFKEGDKFYKRMNFEGALECFNEVLKIEPNNPKALNNKGNMYFRLGKLDDALENYELALKADPNLFEVEYGKALVYNAQNRHLEAVVSFEKFKEKAPTNSQEQVQYGETVIINQEQPKQTSDEQNLKNKIDLLTAFALFGGILGSSFFIYFSSTPSFTIGNIAYFYNTNVVNIGISGIIGTFIFALLALVVGTKAPKLIGILLLIWAVTIILVINWYGIIATIIFGYMGYLLLKIIPKK